MGRGTDRHGVESELRCETCGQLPHAPRLRWTIASVVTVLPVELAVHAVVVQAHLPLAVKALVLALTATALVIWVTEPLASVLLRRWIHAPAILRRRRLHASSRLLRVRVSLADRPGSLSGVTRAMTRIGADILGIHAHQLDGSVMDEFVLSVPYGVEEGELRERLAAAGARDILVAPTTPMLVADGQTRALSLAARVAADPDALAGAVSELLGALPVGPDEVRRMPADGTVLKIPSPRLGAMLFSRPGEPFTPAESARAHRLAELAELVELGAPAHG